EMERAIDLFSQVVASLPGDRAREHLGLPVLPAVFARSYLAECLSETGQFGEALRLAGESISLAEERTHPDTSLLGVPRSGGGAPPARRCRAGHGAARAGARGLPTP